MGLSASGLAKRPSVVLACSRCFPRSYVLNPFRGDIAMSRLSDELCAALAPLDRLRGPELPVFLGYAACLEVAAAESGDLHDLPRYRQQVWG